ncbi:MAG: hypothetical protein HY243_02340 [Proteobacteria bacterium]|nr:hypothetical protein [Pseudomonadota bacterium]
MPGRYAQRAEECVRLASLAQDELIRAELLRLRQTYLNVAAKLANSPGDDMASRKPFPNN